MASIAIRNTNKFVLLDDEDADRLRDAKFYLDKQDGYPLCWVSGRKGAIPVHRVVVGPLPTDDSVIDHIDGDRLNNRRANLRVVTEHLNQVNRHVLNRNNTTGYRGIHLKNRPNAKKRWLAQIGVRGRRIHIGYFETAEEAFIARREAELKHFGELCPVPE